MYAPIYPTRRCLIAGRSKWHKVNVDHLHAICNAKAVLLMDQAREELPAGADLCETCRYMVAQKLLTKDQT